MGFFTKGKSKGELEEEIILLENRLTDERDRRINAEIELSRSESNFNAREEELRSNNEVEVARLEGTVTKLEDSLKAGIEAGVRQAKTQMERELESDKASYRKYLKTEFNDKIVSLEKKILAQAEELTENYAQDDVVKALTSQLTHVNGVVNKLTDAIVKGLPEVSANITTPNPSVVVGSGNKG